MGAVQLCLKGRNFSFEFFGVDSLGPLWKVYSSPHVSWQKQTTYVLTVMDPRVMAFIQLLVHLAMHSRELMLSCFQFSSEGLISVIG